MAELADELNSHCRVGSGIPAHNETRVHPAGSCKTTICSSKFGCSCAVKYTVDTPYTVYVPAVPDDTCVILNHSGSDNVVRLLLATYDNLWNIRAVYTTAGAGGGSEVASAMFLSGSIDAGPYLSDTDSPATCGFTWWMDVDTARSGYGLGRWAWDDTNGTEIYHLASPGSSPGSRGADWVDDFFPGTNDHGVAYHSSLGRADVGPYVFPEDVGPNGNYSGHYPEGLGIGSWYWGTTPPGGHFQSKRSFFWFFADDMTQCNAFEADQSICNIHVPNDGPSYYEQFLTGFVKGGWCFGDCGPYY